MAVVADQTRQVVSEPGKNDFVKQIRLSKLLSIFSIRKALFLWIYSPPYHAYSVRIQIRKTAPGFRSSTICNV
jgi:hypothetical protein